MEKQAEVEPPQTAHLLPNLQLNQYPTVTAALIPGAGSLRPGTATKGQVTSCDGLFHTRLRDWKGDHIQGGEGASGGVSVGGVAGMQAKGECSSKTSGNGTAQLFCLVCRSERVQENNEPQVKDGLTCSSIVG